MTRVHTTVTASPASAPDSSRAAVVRSKRAPSSAALLRSHRSLDSIPVLPFMDDAGGVESIDLPFRRQLERTLGRPLDHLTALTGPRVAELLSALDAEAAAFGRYVLFSDPNPAMDVVLHEVVHALQADSAAFAAFPQVLDPLHPAEAEAERLAGADAAGPVTETIAGNTVALLRKTAPETGSPDGLSEAERFERSMTEEAVGHLDARADASEEAVEAASEPDSTAPEAKAETSVEASEETPNPTFDLPEMPATELSPEEQAARQAELEQAQAAIENAGTAEEVVGAYADAPPTVKAAAQSVVESRLQEVVSADAQTFEENLPEFHAVMGGPPAAEPAGEVQAPPLEPVALEAGTPPPAPLPDLPPTPTPRPYTANNEVVGLLARLFGFGAAEAIGRSLSQVRTRDEVETSPGAKPRVPLEGDTNPQRVEDQTSAANLEARAKRDEAMQAVVEGRGPEEVQLREMDELFPMEALPAAETDGLDGSAEAERLNAMELPEEVLAQFDRDLGATMQENLGDARQQFGQAEAERDRERTLALSEAEREQGRLTAEADEQQRAGVLDARETIQQERQSAIDGQAEAVRQLEADAETERAASQSAIQDRVRQDEAQISENYDNAEAEAQAEVRAGEAEAEAEREKADREAENTSWWRRAVNFVKKAFARLTSIINGIFDAVRSVVKGVLDAVRSVVKGLIDLAADFIKGAISAFGAVLKGLIDVTIGQVFPELAAELNAGIDRAVDAAHAAVDAVADKLKAGVDAIVDALNSALNAVLNVFQAAVNAALAVMEAVITGDWGALARKLLESVLRILGIDPAAFYAFIGRILDSIQLIIDDPIGFLRNVVHAVTSGIQRFADNFLVHLQAGVIAWLTGALGGLQIPREFNLAGVLDLGRQVLNLTWDWVRRKAVRLVGEKNVERIEYLFGYVQTLIDEGFPALWERLKQDLGGLVDRVLGSIREFLVEKIIIAGITWIASLFNPVGAIVKLVFTIWNLYTFIRDQFARIVQIVQSVVQSLADIVRGVVESAAMRIESALASMLPVAINLVANLLGLTGVAARVREIISSIREWIDQALTRLIDRVLRAFRPRSGEAVAATGGEAAAAETADPGSLGAPLAVAVDGGPDHTLSIAASGTDATVMLASDPLPVSRWLADLEGRIPELDDEKKQKAAARSITKARGHLAKLDPQADSYLGARAAGKEPSAKEVQKTKEKLRDALVEVFGRFGKKGAPILEIFGARIEAAHEDAQRRIRTVLTEDETTFQNMTWEDIREKLIASHEPFRSPMLVEHAFGKKAQAAAKAFIPADANLLPEQAPGFLSHWVTRSVNNEGGTFETARNALRKILFEKGDPAQSEELRAAVKQALANFQSSDDKPDADLVAEVGGGRIIDFLTHVASGKPRFGKLDLSKWESEYWGKPANREWIKQRFRGPGGAHEWIPTNYVEKVVDRGRSAAKAGDAPAAALWVKFQDAFRSPTEVLFYPPEGRYLRHVSHPRDPATFEKLAHRKVTVIQGHVGAVYAPVGDDGEYRDDVVAQTKAQSLWHDDLRRIFDNNPGTDAGTMGKMLGQMDEFIRTDLWYGEPVPHPGFNEYYAAAGKPHGNVRSFGDLQQTASGAAKQIQNDFHRARTVVGI